ncbi:MAG TPA: hypothetical protein VG520_09925 [Candidatus Dormibacteraeota bacterium]|nr:hypothetical protein [Candidatus Dormibacteraeota bacterium]
MAAAGYRWARVEGADALRYRLHSTMYTPQITAEPLPPPSPAQPFGVPAARHRRRLPRGARAVAPLAMAAIVLGVLLGGRASAEDGRSAAAAALAGGDPARAVTLDEDVAGRSGFLMALDPGAADAAGHDAQVARIAWATKLAATGSVDSALSALTVVRQPALLGKAAQARALILIAAAAAASRTGQDELALQRLDEAAQGSPPSSLVHVIAAMKAIDEVRAAAQLVATGRAPDAVALLDNASATGGAVAAAAAYPSTLLAAARVEIASLDFQEATATLQRLVTGYGGSAEARTARGLLHAPQTVSGTLVDAAAHPAAGRVRLSTHFTQLSGGYVTSGPFYYGTAAATGDFSIAAVPVGGPYVLEYFRGGGWMTLVDPRTDQPADPVTVQPLQPVDLSFIVLPA